MKPGFRLPPLLLTNEEAFALSLGLRALRQVGLSVFAPAMEGTLAKLERVLPNALHDSIRTVEEVVAIEPGPWVASTSVECLIRAASAIRTCRRIGFAYRSHSGAASQRQIEPYAVIHTDGRWYLIGYCLSRRELRTFRLDRVTDVAVGRVTFRRPANFDVDRHAGRGGQAYLCPHEDCRRSAGRGHAIALRPRPARYVCGVAAQLRMPD